MNTQSDQQEAYPMGSVRPWQIAVIAISLIVLGGSLFFSLRNPNKVVRADQVYLVDAVTGQMFVFQVKGRGGITVPAFHPDTGERTLFRVHPGESGDWEIDSRDLSELEAIEGLSTAFDLEARRASPTGADRPRRLTREDILKFLDG